MGIIEAILLALWGRLANFKLTNNTIVVSDPGEGYFVICRNMVNPWPSSVLMVCPTNCFLIRNFPRINFKSEIPRHMGGFFLIIFATPTAIDNTYLI